MESKRDGFRHWLLYTTSTWHEPIDFKGASPNANCVGCHGTVPKFRAVPSHQALRELPATIEVSCYRCHGLPHPVMLGSALITAGIALYVLAVIVDLRGRQALSQCASRMIGTHGGSDLRPPAQSVPGPAVAASTPSDPDSSQARPLAWANDKRE